MSAMLALVPYGIHPPTSYSMPTLLSVPPSPNEDVSDDSEETLHFDYPGSDIVIRSCDSHDFRVLQLYLANSSPVLRELMRGVQNTSDVANCEEKGLLPVIKLPESGEVLHNLLTFIFPIAPILPSTAEKIMELLAVAQKYQMDSVLCQIRGAIARQDPPFIRPETALHVYFLAQERELHEEAVQAARVTFRLSMTIEDLGDKLDFPGMTGPYLYELWKYHQRVRTDLKSGVPEFRNSGLPNDVKGLRCITRRSPQNHSYPRWLDDFIESVATSPHLFDLIEFENARARHIKNEVYKAACSCVDISTQVIRAFWEALTAFVHGTIEKADSTLALVKEDPASENSDPLSVPLCLDTPDASIILRSSDQVNFRVHKSLLAMSSPFFKDLLSLPQPPDDELVDGLPVVQLLESSGLLNGLISLLYPVSPVIPSSYEKVLALLAASQKYDMVSVQSNIRAAIKLGTFPAAPVGTEAFGAYAAASSMGLVPEMENAAHLTLNYPMTFESLGEGLRSFKGRALGDLVGYRKLCGTRVPRSFDEYYFE